MTRWQMALAVRFCGVVACAQLAGCGWVSDQIMKANPAVALAAGGAKAAASKAPIGLEEERAYGGAIAIKVVQKYGGLVEDAAIVKYVGLVGNVVAAFSDRPTIKYYFGVLKSEGVNAVSAPGGYVFITMGALRRMKSEAELAGVLAHEVGHITARHALEIIKNLKAKSAMVSAAATTMDNADFFKDIVNAFLNDFLERGLPKETEFEADGVGTSLLMKAGYDAGGLRDFLAGMAHPKADHKDPFYDTHPDTSERVGRIDEQVKKAGGRTGLKLTDRLQKQLAALPAPTPASATPPASAEPAAKDAAPAAPATKK